MTTPKWILGVAASAALLCVSSALAQVADDAKQVLTDSQAAVGKIEAMTYKVKKSGTGMLKDIVDLSGDVKHWRPVGAAAPTVHVKGRWKEPGKKDGQLVFTRDAQSVTWLDFNDNARVNAQLNDSKSQEVLSSAKNFLVSEMVVTDYENMLRMAKVEKAGVEKVGGEMCELIVGTSADGSRVFTFAVSVADRIPRRLEMATGQGEGKIAMITEVMDVKPATLAANNFTIDLPQGFVEKNLGAAATPAITTTTPAITLGPKRGEPAPEFSIKDSTGAVHTPASLKDNVVVMQFFGTMFKASVTGAAEMQLLATEMKGRNVVFVGLSCRELSEGAGVEFFKTNNLTYTLIPKGDDAAAAFNIKGYPSYVVIDTTGKVTDFFQDNPGKDKLTEAILAAGAK